MADVVSDTFSKMIRSLDQLREFSDRMVVSFYRLEQYTNRFISSLQGLEIRELPLVPQSENITTKITNISYFNNISNVGNTSNISNNTTSAPAEDDKGIDWIERTNQVVGTINDGSDIIIKGIELYKKIFGKKDSNTPNQTPGEKTSLSPFINKQQDTVQNVTAQYVTYLYAENLIIAGMQGTRRNIIDVTPSSTNNKNRTPNLGNGGPRPALNPGRGASGFSSGFASGAKGSGSLIGTAAQLGGFLSSWISGRKSQANEELQNTVPQSSGFIQETPAEKTVPNLPPTPMDPQKLAPHAEELLKTEGSAGGFNFGNILSKGKSLLKFGSKALGPLNVVSTVMDIATSDNKPKAILSAVTSTGLAVAGNMLLPGVGGIVGGIVGDKIGNFLGDKIFKGKEGSQETQKPLVSNKTEQLTAPLTQQYPPAVGSISPSPLSGKDSAVSRISTNETKEIAYQIKVEDVQVVMPKEEVDIESLAKRIGWEIATKLKGTLDNRTVTP